MTIHILSVPSRAIDPLVAQTHSLFLAREAVAQGDQSDVTLRTVKELCASPNAAIANAAFSLLPSLRMKP